MINNQLPLRPRTQQTKIVAESLSPFTSYWMGTLPGGAAGLCIQPNLKPLWTSFSQSGWERGALWVKLFFFKWKDAGVTKFEQAPTFSLWEENQRMIQTGRQAARVGNEESWDSSFIPGFTQDLPCDHQQATSQPVSQFSLLSKNTVLSLSCNLLCDFLIKGGRKSINEV